MKNATNYHLLFEEVVAHQDTTNFRLLFEEAVTHQNTFDINLVDLTYDEIAKTNQVKACTELCGEFWNVKHNLCVDEMMVQYIGKYSPIQQ
jgi:formylmethanofuran dehydrogenase subunit E